MKSIGHFFFLFFFRSDLNSAHWMTEIEGLGAIVRLMKYHSDIVLPDINELIHALNHECKNLRSQVISKKEKKIRENDLIFYFRLQELQFKLF